MNSLSKYSTDKNVVGDRYKKIDRDALVKLRCKRAGSGTVIGVFHTYYNKWFVSPQEFIGWDESENQEELKKTRVLVNPVEKTGSSVRDVELKQDSSLGP